MTTITRWLEYPTPPLDEKIYVRSTLAYGGPTMSIERNEWGTPIITTFSSAPQLVPARYSVVHETSTGIKYKIISGSYVTPFNDNNPYEVHRKYVDGETQDLFVQDFAGTLEEALLWNGMVQELLP